MPRPLNLAFACVKMAVRRAGAPLKDTAPQTPKPLTAKRGVCTPMIHPASSPRRGEAPPGRWTHLKPEGATLLEHDVRYLAERGVDLQTAQAAGYWSATKPSEIPDVYSAYFRRQ